MSMFSSLVYRLNILITAFTGLEVGEKIRNSTVYSWKENSNN